MDLIPYLYIMEDKKILVSELEDFFFQMGEDYHLWDEQEKGPYPMERTFDAMRKFIDIKKSK